MSRLFILTRPTLVSGFHLAGVEAYGAKDAQTARDLIEKWLSEGELGLLAIDDSLLAQMDAAFLKRLDSYKDLSYLAIPGGQKLGPEVSETQRITELIRQAIGFHITFKTFKGEGEKNT